MTVSAKAQASRKEGQEFEIRMSKTNGVHNLYMLLHSLALGVTKPEYGLISTVSG